MYQTPDKGFFTHTATARPYWMGDVNITNLRPAPRRQGGSGLKQTVVKVIAAIAGR